jgi:hypothetical protein
MSKQIWSVNGDLVGNIGSGPDFPFGIPGCGLVAFCFFGGVALTICCVMGGAMGFSVPQVLNFLVRFVPISLVTGYISIMVIPEKLVATPKGYLFAGTIYVASTALIYMFFK